MSRGFQSWYSLPDLMALADRAAAIEASLPLASFGRLGPLLNRSEGAVNARVEFRRGHDDLLELQLQYAARLELTCQRCLEPLVYELDERVGFAVAASEDSLAVLPQGLELIALEGDRLQPATLLEDELIVSLPLVPRHGEDEP